MRHKQRPVKSSRSVTFIIDSHTSFGDNNDPHHHHHNHPHHNNHKSSSYLTQPIVPSATHRHTTNTNQNQNNHRNTISSASSTSASYLAALARTSASSSTQQDGSHNTQHSRAGTTILATNDQRPLMRKQFDHNYRHMSDVMRLAFLENNDISIDDISNVDFNAMSTASILQRNIQHQLQQQRKDQLQLRQQQQQQQQQQHQQHQHQQQHQQHYQQQQHFQQHLHHQDQFHRSQYQPDDSYDQDLGDDEDFDNDEDYEITDNRIFATATPTSSRTNLSVNTPKSTHSSSNKSAGRIESSATVGSAPSSTGRKRTRESMPHVEFSNHVQVETTPQNHGDGFLCDEPGCGKSFPSLRKLRHHKVVHSDDFPFVCEFNGCSKKFKRKFGIDLHSTTHFDLDPGMYSKTSNNSSLPFFGRRMQYSMCKPCGQKFRTVHEYQYHMLKHGKEPFKCPVKGCGQTFGIWKSFQKHRASHYFNYYCKMDPRCDHHTSNLQLLKLHIYCCHFRRKLPENATLASRDQDQDQNEGDVTKDEQVNIVDTEEQSQRELSSIKIESEDSITVDDISPPPKPVTTPRRDSRLRKNPPRSSAFGQQDYASVNNGASFAKSLASTPQMKRTRSSLTSSSSQSAQSERKIKLLLKVLPKRNAQRLPMCLIAGDASTEGDDAHSEGEQQHQQLVAADSDYDNDEDYDVSNSRIFATAAPTSSNRSNSNVNTPKSTQSSSKSNSSLSVNSSQRSTSKKRTRELVSHDEFPDHVQVETTPQNHGDGFLCDEPGCGKSFPSLRKLRHHKVVHSDDFPFVCEFNGCSKKFKRKFGIDLHSTTHFDLDPGMYSKTSNNSSLPFFGRRMQYSICKPCGQKFKTVHDYQYHMLKHGKEPFKCPVKGCGQTFGIWKSFQKHRASHYFNYYCKMDPRCDHHTSNLQLLKLHIYCCHFRRKLPENATLASRDQDQEQDGGDVTKEEQVDVDDSEEQSQREGVVKMESEESITVDDDVPSPPKPVVTTPRRDSRLRKNPPRSSAFGHIGLILK